jgi:hypothetical protein
MVFVQFAIALAFTLSVALAQPSFAQSVTPIGSGATTLRIDPTFESSVSTSGLALGAVGESSVLDGLFIFPVVEGAIDADTARADIMHGGGLELFSQTLNVSFINLIVDTTTAAPQVTADLVVNNALVVRIPLFDLQLPPLTLPLDTRSGRVSIPATTVTLRSEAAEILNRILGATNFSGGQPIGTSEMTWEVGESGI